jgi:hypothetical protein
MKIYTKIEIGVVALITKDSFKNSSISLRGTQIN